MCACGLLIVTGLKTSMWLAILHVVSSHVWTLSLITYAAMSLSADPCVNAMVLSYFAYGTGVGFWPGLGLPCDQSWINRKVLCSQGGTAGLPAVFVVRARFPA